ncbi:FAD-binding oxidoreductase [Microbispora bryophytorum]|uniref:FAD-binding oxidoreductase n=1 Tax=Microbispora bryophytorum subsp. camponoti TaxID=1677852 RepID=A0ABR8L028_9ACTN|nr:FAD-binding oxidoreductase [Microbispora camponoti]MBD3144359.1 FAD-binding oxidoreductase [Microbispora camponoti]
MAARDVGDALEAAGVAVRAAGDGDEVAGVRPRWVALPESAEEIAAVMRVCATHDLAAVATGGGTKLHWGAPPDRCDVLVDLCCMNRPPEHAAGDLVVRAQAGVTVEALARTLAEGGQELALDVPVPGTTVGGLLATGIAGPRRFRHGTARDLLIGVTVVLADGTIAKSGGKVVKNVAGYDLGKLFTGSYGTLGIIADATFRLHPLPAARAWVTATVERPVTNTYGTWTNEDGLTFETLTTDLAGSLATMVPAVTESPLEPSAVEMDWPDAEGPCTVAVLVEGAAAAERAKALCALMGGALSDVQVTEEPPPWWGRLPEPPAPDGPPGTLGEGDRDSDGGEILLEVRNTPSHLTDSFVGPLTAAHEAGVRAAVRGSLASHVFHVALPPGTEPRRVAAFTGGLRAHMEADGDGRVVVLAAPQEAARRLDRWGHVGALPLMRRVKERFDPDRRLSPGRFLGGI